ncbi:RNA polymerase sigma factor [Phaeodactylibacter luteus]|uniref:RNA polymerase sigma factor n=1 Tax=Phaeodactylibacter luteus TaxID=1564516 RepID=A0A5C6RPF4_9BACT|nr:sigma-70 family RNA polymerase sigma factor [Phaeodactylibacter luteus]TXB64113.1 sigma-70 family RNA polymerase sigma factor [Phaeodactylibacter luteus]
MKHLETIIKRLQSGDRAVMSTLYDEFAPALYGVVLRIVHDEAIAQDIVQETFIKAWKNGGSYDPGKGTLFTWLLNIARNGAIDKTRSAAFRNQRQTASISDGERNSSALSTVTATDHIGLRKMVGALEDKYQDVIELAYFQGFTQPEIAERLGLPLGTVKTRARIALRELRKFFSEAGVSKTIIIALALPFV